MCEALAISSKFSRLKNANWEFHILVRFLLAFFYNFRSRRKNQPPLPANLIDLEIPQRLTETLDNRQFLMHDSGPQEDRILLFSTEESLQILSQQNRIFVDGTFKSCPTMFFQVNVFMYNTNRKIRGKLLSFLDYFEI